MKTESYLKVLDGIKLSSVAHITFGAIILFLLSQITSLKSEVIKIKSEFRFQLLPQKVYSLTKDETHQIESNTKRDIILAEIDDRRFFKPSLIYSEEPAIFKNVKPVPSIFAINNLNFTNSKSFVKNCDCVEGQEK